MQSREFYRSIVFSPDYFGPLSCNGKPEPISKGFMAGWSSKIPSMHYISRGPAKGCESTDFMDYNDVKKVIYNDSLTYTQFRARMEYAHSTAQKAIGGDMDVSILPFFYCLLYNS